MWVDQTRVQLKLELANEVHHVRWNAEVQNEKAER